MCVNVVTQMDTILIGIDSCLIVQVELSPWRLHCRYSVIACVFCSAVKLECTYATSCAMLNRMRNAETMISLTSCFPADVFLPLALSLDGRELMT